MLATRRGAPDGAGAGGVRKGENAHSDAIYALQQPQTNGGATPPPNKRQQVVCRLPPFLSKHLLSVTPVVARVPADFTPAPNPDEVDAAFDMPLAAFLSAAHHLHWDVGSGGGRGRNGGKGGGGGKSGGGGGGGSGGGGSGGGGGGGGGSAVRYRIHSFEHRVPGRGGERFVVW